MATPKGEQAVDAIMEAAETLFLSQGFNGTSMRDIARQAGYKSVAGIYNHFPDKETILIALLNTRSPYPRIFALVDQLEGDTAAEFIPNLFQAVTRLVNENTRFIGLVMLDFLEFNAVHVKAILTNLQAPIVRILQRLQGMEGWRKDVPPIVIVRTIGMLIFGYVITQNLLPAFVLQMLTEEEWKKSVMDILLNGVGDKQ